MCVINSPSVIVFRAQGLRSQKSRVGLNPVHAQLLGPCQWAAVPSPQNTTGDQFHLVRDCHNEGSMFSEDFYPMPYEAIALVLTVARSLRVYTVRFKVELTIMPFLQDRVLPR